MDKIPSTSLLWIKDLFQVLINWQHLFIAYGRTFFIEEIPRYPRTVENTATSSEYLVQWNKALSCLLFQMTFYRYSIRRLPTGLLKEKFLQILSREGFLGTYREETFCRSCLRWHSIGLWWEVNFKVHFERLISGPHPLGTIFYCLWKVFFY